MAIRRLKGQGRSNWKPIQIPTQTLEAALAHFFYQPVGRGLELFSDQEACLHYSDTPEDSLLIAIMEYQSTVRTPSY